MGINEVVTPPQSPWQNPFAERLIGSIRRECPDHIKKISLETSGKLKPELVPVRYMKSDSRNA